MSRAAEGDAERARVGLHPRTAAMVLAVGFPLLLALASVPIFSTVLPPLVDYPNHLARLHLIAEGGNHYYAVQWAPLPDLAADVIVPLLARALPLALAGKLFLVLIFALLAGGTAWLNRLATGCWRVWPLLAFLVLYNRSFLWGFLNYLFGLGVALVGLAWWLALERRPAWQRIVASSIAALTVFFSHIAALGIYGLALFGAELVPTLRELRGRRYSALAHRLAVAAAQFVIPAVIFFGFAPRETGGEIGYGGIWRKIDMLFSVFDNYDRVFDIACFALVLLLFAGLTWRRRIDCERRVGTAALVVFAAYLFLPNQLYSGFGLDHRLPPAIFLLLIAATSPRLGDWRQAAMLGAVIGAVLIARLAVIEAVWLHADRAYAADIAALDLLPQSTRLAVAYPARLVNAGGIPQLHVATLAAARREAFVPTLFAYPTQQPIAPRPPYAELAAATEPGALWSGLVQNDGAARARLAPILRDYDFIVFADREPITVAPRPCLRPLPSPENFRLFALDHTASCD